MYESVHYMTLICRNQIIHFSIYIKRLEFFNDEVNVSRISKYLGFWHFIQYRFFFLLSHFGAYDFHRYHSRTCIGIKRFVWEKVPEDRAARFFLFYVVTGSNPLNNDLYRNQFETTKQDSILYKLSLLCSNLRRIPST